MPILMPGQTPGVNGYNRLLKPEATAEWFIADASHLEVSFRDKLPLLAFSIEETGRMKRLLKMTHLEHRNLSEVVQGNAETVGNSVFWREYTTTLRSKTNSILRYVNLCLVQLVSSPKPSILYLIGKLIDT